MSKHFPLSEMQQKSKRRKETNGVIAPKYIMKIISATGISADVTLYYCKNHLLADMMVYWNEKYNIIVQQFISSRSFKACIYRFYRNEKNVYRAECLINKKSVK